MKHIPKEVKDYLVSNETFELRPSKKYKGLLQTHPAPAEKNLAFYYESESYDSHKDKAKGIFDKLYFLVQSYNLRYKHKLIGKPSQNNVKTLDYGCGTGEFVYYLSNQGYDAYGMEPSKKAFQIASLKNPKKIYNSNQILNYAKFDVITLYHVLEHIPNWEKEIPKIINALKPNGELFIAVPNYKSFDAKYYKEYWAAYDVPRHLWHFTEETIIEIFSEFGMIIESIEPMYFDSFYVGLLSERNKRNPFGFFMGPLIGLISNIKAMFNGQFSSKIYKIKREN